MSPIEIFNQLHKHVLNLDPDGQANLFAENGIWEFPFAPESFPKRIEGRENIRNIGRKGMERSRANGRRLTGYHSISIHETTEENVIIVEFELHGEIVETAKFYQIPYIQLIQTNDDKIVLLRDYFPSEILKNAFNG